MKRLLLLVALFAFGSFYSTSYAQRVKITCPTTLNDIDDCPDTGCGNVDPHLNRAKNIRSLNGEPEPMTIQQMRQLPDPVPGFKVGNTREKIQASAYGHFVRFTCCPPVAAIIELECTGRQCVGDGNNKDGCLSTPVSKHRKPKRQ